MKFGEKLKELRIAKGLTQQEFADQLGISLRTVTNYETGSRYPKKRELYTKMAEILQTDINYLLTEDEAFLTDACELYGSRGQKQARELLSEIGGLFAGGELAEEDMDEMMQAIQEAYWIAKKKNRKYVPKKHAARTSADDPETAENKPKE